jgi:hypothetical protein
MTEKQAWLHIAYQFRFYAETGIEYSGWDNTVSITLCGLYHAVRRIIEDYDLELKMYGRISAHLKHTQRHGFLFFKYGTEFALQRAQVAEEFAAKCE